MGAFMNVRINAVGYDDKNYVNELLERGKVLEQKSIAEETEILKIVNAKIGI
jgi:glutamate formiminotransferase/formiminotetrahydrofolate cyclodeaminase